MSGTDDGNKSPPVVATDRLEGCKAAAIILERDKSAEDALAEIMLSGIEHLRANESCVLARAEEECIHQMRVALRRMRSGLTLYRDLLPAEQRKYVNTELRWLIGELGPARDWDVFLSQTLAPVCRSLPDDESLGDLHDAAEAKRVTGYQRAESAIRSQRYVGLVMLVNSWAEGRGWRDGTDGTSQQAIGLQDNVEVVADQLLDQRYHQVRRIGRRFTSLNGEQRHRLRIEIKKLRYATEFFGSLYPTTRVASYVDRLKALQDRLGTANDIAVATRLLEEITGDTHGKQRARLSFAAGLVIGWHSHVSNHQEEKLLYAWRRFTRAHPFWGAASTGGSVAGRDVHVADAKDKPEPLPAPTPEGRPFRPEIVHTSSAPEAAERHSRGKKPPAQP